MSRVGCHGQGQGIQVAYIYGVLFFLSVPYALIFFFYSQNKPEIGQVLLSPLDEQEEKWGARELKQHILYPQSK